MNEKKKAFISYSNQDREFARRLSDQLFNSGIEVWIDQYEIKAGDSLVEKIFSEGLAKADFFIILLSNSSVNSSWVKEELSIAVINRINGLTKIIPVLKEKCEIPVPLRALKWVDLSVNFEDGIRDIVKSVFDVSDKPATGSPPNYISDLTTGFNGLSLSASQLALFLVNDHINEGIGLEKTYTNIQLHELINALSEKELNFAVDELEEFGLISVSKALGTHPYTFSWIEPTYALFLHLKDRGLKYDPEEDIKSIANVLRHEDK